MGRNLPMSFAQETSLWHEKCVCVSVFLCLWYQAFAAKQMRTALIWVIMQWVVVISYWCFGRNYRSHLWGSKIQNGSWTLKMGPIACSETSVINYPTCCVIIQKSTVLTCVCGCTLSVLLITAIQVSCGKQPPWVHLLCPDKDQHWLLHHYVQGQPKWPHVCPKRQLPLFFFCGLGGVNPVQPKLILVHTTVTGTCRRAYKTWKNWPLCSYVGIASQTQKSQRSVLRWLLEPMGKRHAY